MQSPIQPTPSPSIERWLAHLLQYGSWLAMLVMTSGLIAAFFNFGLGINMATGGIGLLILLPVLRVLAMLGYFLAKKDYWLSLMSGLVLLIIALGYFMGLSKGLMAG